jgi:phosphoglycerol transferase MdoB-like AlkP superfamily enzyme
MDIKFAPSTGRVYFALFLAFFVAIAVIIILFHTQKNPYSKISNFDDCVRAGYPVMQSYPEQCTLPNGKFFVSQIVQGN